MHNGISHHITSHSTLPHTTVLLHSWCHRISSPTKSICRIWYYLYLSCTLILIIWVRIWLIFRFLSPYPIHTIPNTLKCLKSSYTLSERNSRHNAPLFSAMCLPFLCSFLSVYILIILTRSQTYFRIYICTPIKCTLMLFCCLFTPKFSLKRPICTIEYALYIHRLPLGRHFLRTGEVRVCQNVLFLAIFSCIYAYFSLYIACIFTGKYLSHYP